jgi:hypothetical protein
MSLAPNGAKIVVALAQLAEHRIVASAGITAAVAPIRAEL